jgi:hypothetical protein
MAEVKEWLANKRRDLRVSEGESGSRTEKKTSSVRVLNYLENLWSSG